MSVLGNSVKLGIYFMMLHTSYGSFSTIITQLYKQEGYTNLGLYSTFTNEASFMISNIFAPYIGTRFSSKWLMTFAGCCYSFNFLTGFLITYFQHQEWMVYSIVMLGAAIGGGSASLLWISQGYYMHNICEAGGKQAEKGYYFGVFSNICSMSNILGGVATTFLLGFLSANMYFLIITAIGVASVAYNAIFLDNADSPKTQRLSLMTDDALEPERSQAVVQKFDPMAVFRFYPKMLVMLSFIGVVGFILAFERSILPGIIEQSLPKDSSFQYIRLRTGVGIMIIGVGNILGGYMSGFNADRLSIKTIGGIAVSLYLIVCQTNVLANETRDQTLAYVASFGWGFLHSYIQTWISISCSRNYQGRLESFSISKQFHSLTLCLFQLFLIFGNPSFSLVLIIMSLCTVFCIMSLSQLGQQKAKDI